MNFKNMLTALVAVVVTGTAFGYHRGYECNVQVVNQSGKTVRVQNASGTVDYATLGARQGEIGSTILNQFGAGDKLRIDINNGEFFFYAHLAACQYAGLPIKLIVMPNNVVEEGTDAFVITRPGDGNGEYRRVRGDGRCATCPTCPSCPAGY